MSLNAPWSPGYRLTEPRGAEKARLLPHWVSGGWWAVKHVLKTGAAGLDVGDAKGVMEAGLTWRS